jgi:lysophospholipase L1-like esterase
MDKKKVFYASGIAVGFVMIYFIVRNYFVKKKKRISNILFVGDSITAIESAGKPVTTTYPNLIKKQLQSKGVNVDVLAEGGKTTSWQLTNLTEKLKSNKYDRVYIYGGINDIFGGSTSRKVLDNIQKMIDLINEKGAEPFVIIGYDAKSFMTEDKLKPTKDVPTKAGMLDLKKKYVDYQNQISDTIKNATIVDKFDIPSSMTQDGIHPTPSGQEIIANSLLKDLM